MRMAKIRNRPELRKLTMIATSAAASPTIERAMLSGLPERRAVILAESPLIGVAFPTL